MSDFEDDDDRYFLRWGNDQPWQEVSRHTWLEAEHAAGFRGGGFGVRPNPRPSTAGWSAGSLSGMICPKGRRPDDYLRGLA